jgi:hypothetical protein
MITCGKWGRINEFWPILGITTSLVFRTVENSKDLFKDCGSLQGPRQDSWPVGQDVFQVLARYKSDLLLLNKSARCTN